MSRRAVGVIRLSKLTDETTSLARQREIITRKAADRGATIVGWAVDDDISATQYAPHKRPELRKWLDRPDDFDEVIYWRLDRFVRKVRDLMDMIDWSRAHGKGLLSATESFDLDDPTGQGEAMATMAALFGQMESRTTSIRVTGAHAYLRTSGRWQGGNFVYGYRAVANPEGPGWVLVQDEHSAAVVREAVDRVLNGEAVLSIATDFNRRGIRCPQDYQRTLKGVPLRCTCKHERRDHGPTCEKCDCQEYTEYKQEWARSSLHRILRSEAMLGRVIHKGKAVLGDDGTPIVRTEPLIDIETFARLQDGLQAGSVTRRRTQTPSKLLSIGHCGCGKRVWKWQKPNPNGIVFSYYRCEDNYKRRDDPGRCNAGPIPCGTLDDIFTSELLAHVGDCYVTRLEVIPGDGHEKELAAVGQQISKLTQDKYVHGIDLPDFDRVMARLQAEHARLSDLPPSPDVIRRVPTNQTYREKVESMGATERRLWLRDSGVRVWAMRGEWPAAADHSPVPLVPSEIPTRILLLPEDTARGRLRDLFVVIDLGVLTELLERAQ